VADTGPLLHLAEIGQLHQLRIFTHLHVPAAVKDELTAQAPGAAEELARLAHCHTLAVSDVARFVTANVLDHLHRGEQESIYLCFQRHVPLLLTDDLAVRKAAARLDLTAVGSLGIIGRSYHLGHISLQSAQAAVADLCQNSGLCGMLAIPELAVAYLERLAMQSKEGLEKTGGRAM
jgi:predicted nucleic acid-binding protein